MNNKVILVLVVLVFFIAFILLSLYTYSSSTANTNQQRENINHKSNVATESLKNLYGCIKYGPTDSIHCETLPNHFVSSVVPSNSSLLYTSSSKAAYVAGIKGRLSMEMDAKRMEAIEFHNSSKLDPVKLSISFWIKNARKDPRPYGVIISHTNSRGNAGWSFDAHVSNRSSNSPMNQFVTFSVFNQIGEQFTSHAAPISSDSTFTHIVGTFDGSSIKIYRNGNLIGSTQFKGIYIPDPGLPLSIGSSSFCLTCNWWSGAIDNLRFYNGSINENEVREIFSNDSLGIVPNGLVGYWTFDGSLNDISGNNNAGIMHTIISSMTFSPDGRLFFTEKNTGKIRIMKDNQLLPTPFAIISDYYVSWEQGLLGLTLDPQFEQNHYVYLYYTSIDNKSSQIFNRVVRFTDNHNQGRDMVVILDKIPASSTGRDSGGALAFGDDEKLYIGVGDALEPDFAQDQAIFTGKVLRINRDGTIPEDNPFRNSPVYTIGHRNIYGIAFDKQSRIGIIAEDGDLHYDKINLLEKGANYGFPTLIPPNDTPEVFRNTSAMKPLISYWQSITPTQAIYYTGDKIPQLKNKFLVGAYSEDIYAYTLNVNDKKLKEQQHIALKHYPFEPVTSIAQSPSGDVYFGGYHIYRLDSLNTRKQEQDLFPIEIKIPLNIGIKDLHAYTRGSKNIVVIDFLHNQNQTTNSSENLQSRRSLEISIPRGIIDDVSSVISTGAVNNGGQKQQQPSAVTAPLNFTIDHNSSSTDSILKIDMGPPSYPTQLSVKGVAAGNNIDNIKASNQQ